MLVFLLHGWSISAQLDSVHWLPPLHARAEWGPHYLYISTPEKDPFPVEIQNGRGELLGVLNISNGQGARFDMPSGQNTQVLVPPDSLLAALHDKGLRLRGDKKFYVNFRFQSESGFQAGDLTCKGQAALGKVFRIGHLYNSASNTDIRNNFAAVLATQDSTFVTLTASDPGVDLQRGGAQTVGSTASIMLYKGESVVFAQYLTFNAAQQPPNGLIGALLTATKPVAVNVGSWLGAPQDRANDAGLDQIVPFEETGTEYILCKGNGSADMETPMVVAHRNNTEVRLNSNSNPVSILQAGQFYRIPTSSFTAAGNLYIETSEPAYVYQMVGGVPSGNDALRTAGLIFVPPVSCSIPNAVDNILEPNRIGTSIFEGGLMIVAMKDSTVELTIDGSPVALGSPQPVTGNPDFVTYRRIDLFSLSQPLTSAAVVAKGAVQVALFGRNGAAGYGAFYSGFSRTRKPHIQLSVVGNGVCPDTLMATGKFDGVQWYYADSLLQFGPDSMFVAYAPGRYIARGYLGVCRKTGFAEDTVTAVFNSPVFPYTVTDPACFNTADGNITIGVPSGGLPPYQYSVNKGSTFVRTPAFEGLRAGTYQVVVRDSTGCYNSPLDLTLRQPDSLQVNASVQSAPDPPTAGEPFVLKAETTRAVVSARWQPEYANDQCGTSCLNYIVRPEYSTIYSVTVADARGCTASDTVAAGVLPHVYAPNVIHPAVENVNSRFMLYTREPVPLQWLRIYDRWGSLVFETHDIMTNDPAPGWDGYAEQRMAPPGVYVFIASLEYLPGRTFLLKGDLTLIR